MSIPPQLIRVKRKRDDDSPVTFLQLDERTKRHRSGTNWVYQRRHSTTPLASSAAAHPDSGPVIHVSKPADNSSPTKRRDEAQDSTPAGALHPPTAQHLEPRRFHVSRAMLAQATTSQSPGTGISKQAAYGPTLFVERGRQKIVTKTSLQSLLAKQARTAAVADTAPSTAKTTDSHGKPKEQKRLKKPGVVNRSRDPSQEPSARNPLPPSLLNRHNEDMSKIAADMDRWVLNELGANLHGMELEKKQSEKLKFRPRAPEKRYQERHPPLTVLTPPVGEAADTPMADASEEEGGEEEWIIEEYVRIPAHSMGLDVPPTDVGVLVLDGETESMLFFGPPQDEDDDFAEDDEDENAENHYTADYPEDEVDSDDEFDRHAYMFRNQNASDDEEFDDKVYNSDEMILEGNDDDDARMDRIREFMKRNSALR